MDDKNRNQRNETADERRWTRIKLRMTNYELRIEGSGKEAKKKRKCHARVRRLIAAYGRKHSSNNNLQTVAPQKSHGNP
ncbi:MAG: hypothetical protein ACYTBZ_07285 [Planctomycetota bacterium]